MGITPRKSTVQTILAQNPLVFRAGLCSEKLTFDCGESPARCKSFNPFLMVSRSEEGFQKMFRALVNAVLSPLYCTGIAKQPRLVGGGWCGRKLSAKQNKIRHEGRTEKKLVSEIKPQTHTYYLLGTSEHEEREEKLDVRHKTFKIYRISAIENIE